MAYSYAGTLLYMPTAFILFSSVPADGRADDRAAVMSQPTLPQPTMIVFSRSLCDLDGGFDGVFP